MKQLCIERKKKTPASGGGSFRSLALKVFFEKLQCSAPGFLGCLGVIAFGLGIIVKSMLGTSIDFVRVSLGGGQFPDIGQALTIGICLLGSALTRKIVHG